MTPWCPVPSPRGTGRPEAGIASWPGRRVSRPGRKHHCVPRRAGRRGSSGVVPRRPLAGPRAEGRPRHPSRGIRGPGLGECQPVGSWRIAISSGCGDRRTRPLAFGDRRAGRLPSGGRRCRGAGSGDRAGHPAAPRSLAGVATHRRTIASAILSNGAVLPTFGNGAVLPTLSNSPASPSGTRDSRPRPSGASSCARTGHGRRGRR